VNIGERYRLRERIGGGATAEVHRAWDRVADRDVAIKLFPEGAGPVREPAILDRLDHPGLIPLYDSGVADGRPYLVMRLVPGPTLAERVADGPLSCDETVSLGAYLADALAHVHDAGITHRDVKPANVLLAPDRPLLGDFGLAHEGTARTGAGLVTGTVAYLAPEQVDGDTAGPSADVFALGLVLLECLSGEREFPGSVTESAVARLFRAPRVPSGLPPHVTDLLTRMGDRDPDGRPDAGEIAAALGGATTMRPRPKRGLAAMVRAAAALALG